MNSSEEASRWRVLVADSEFEEAARDIAARVPDMELVVAPNDDAAAIADGTFDGVIAQTARVDDALLDKLSAARAILKLGRSYFNVDASAVRERELIFASVPRKGPNCVAELAMTLILSLSKDLLVSHQSVAEGAYRLRGLRPAETAQWKMAFHWMRHTGVHEVRGKTLGIVGMGEIGTELARRADVMGMQVLYYKRTPLNDELEARFNVSYRELDDLLRESDYVCLAVPHTPETEKMIGKRELDLMKPGAFLVNICRGGVVDEEAMIEALSAGRLGGAGLDVFNYEPLPADSPLCSLDNVILTPHIGGGTGSNRSLELGEAVEEMQRILSGERPRVPLN